MHLPASLAVLSLALIAPAALADDVVLFSSLNANGSSTGSSTIVWGPIPQFPPTSVAAAFTVTDGTYGLKSLELVFSGTAASGSARVRLFTDNVGLPGTLLETIDYTGTFGSAQEPVTAVFTSVLQPTLAEGATYWVTISSLDDGKNIHLRNNSLGLDIPAAIDHSNDGTWVATSGVDPAFRVIGVVPEPASLLLLAAGGLAMLRRHGR